MITFNENTLVLQRFPFKAPIMNYIFDNLQPQHLIKLYQTCKFFYAKFGLDIIRHLELIDEESDEDEMFTPTKTIIRVSNPALKELKDFWITDSVMYRAPLNLELMPKFPNCTIKKLEASDHLLWSEYETLTAAGTIEELKVAQIFRDGELVAVEELISAVPNAKSIEICESKITPTTFTTLTSLNHEVKISHFVLENMTSRNICIYQMHDFFFKHLDPACNVHFAFKTMPEEGSDAIREYNGLIKQIEIEYNKAVALILDKMACPCRCVKH